MKWETLVFVLACAGAAVVPLLPSQAPVLASAGFPGWPAQFEGRALTALPLTPIELQFQANFPGRVGRFSDGQREIIMRWVAAPTRRLHPAADCFKANGYTLTPLPLHTEGTARWSGFGAVRGATRYRVHERITDSAGQQWSDVSSWYWAAQLGRSSGPWWAVTVAQRQP